MAGQPPIVTLLKSTQFCTQVSLAMPSIKQLPPRSKVKTADTWDLSSLFPSDEAWEKAFAAWEKQIAGYAEFQGKLGDDAETLAACLKFDEEFDRAGERLGTYAHLKTAEDTTDSRYQRMQGRYVNVAGRAAEAASYIRPEILAIPTARMKQFLASDALAPYRLLLERLLRYKPHTLGKKEEKLLAMQTEMAQAAGQVFRQLNDADMKFGPMRNDAGRADRTEPRHVQHAAALAPAKRPQGGVPPILPAVRRPSAHAGRGAWPARCSATSTTPGPATIPARWRRRCFPTACRWRSTTT